MVLSKHNFSEDDKEKIVKFLNMIATHADFKLNTLQIVDYFKLLQYIQQVLLPKIDANILEVKKIVETKESKE
jgi:hypothetical protein